ncbi:putative membrane spanning protein [Borrelia duttonii CR2A]|uniref:Putative membrane spanning protein n=1 Tax=Borrelia duttonii CR2A TaxID=1432657 RepID=W6TKQ5_9SPIR|nr:hypothetical protein [Borrelia duttonii]ETZ17879.1 putative membrane spanning protein [Borrelia duttonii CR2A]
MKRKDFVIFIIFILILLLLVSCGPKKYTPVSSAVRRNRLGPNGVTGGTNTNGVTVGSQVGTGGPKGGDDTVTGGPKGGDDTVTGDNEQILK